MLHTATKAMVAILGTLPLLAIVPPASAAMHGPATAPAIRITPNIAAPEMGLEFFADGDPGQCGGANGAQWIASPTFTSPIRFDTDNRVGGCDFSFGIYDPGNALPGLSVTYTWQVSPGGNAGQCGNNQGTYPMPINDFAQQFGTILRDDTDNRAGWCNLTFTVSGRTDVGLDVEFWADGDPNQCHGALPLNQFYTASAGVPVTIGLDTDQRVGGCWMAIRIRHLGFGPHHLITATHS